MTDFEVYYKTKFREDINCFFSTVPDQSRFHEDNENRSVLSIQYDRLTRKFDHLDFLPTADRINFGVSLYFTVLVDEVCYTHFRSDYEPFRRLTLYPKLIGNCLKGCHLHLNPNEIFSAMYLPAKKSPDVLSVELDDFHAIFEVATPIMEKETKSFLNLHLSDIDEQLFWEMCKKELPSNTIN